LLPLKFIFFLENNKNHSGIKKKEKRIYKLIKIK